MAKAPFERVFSKLERKKLLQKVIVEKVRVVVKDSRNNILEFLPLKFDSVLNIEGSIPDSAHLRDNEKVTALFYLQNERYFIVTRLKKSGENWVLVSDQQFFKLQRRTAFRVQIPPSVELIYQIKSIRNIEMNLKVSVIEFSSGGMRIFWQGTLRPGKGTVLKGSLQWGNGKLIPVDAAIVHSPEAGIYGVRFVNLKAVTVQRLKMLSIEIQQAIYL